MVSLFSINCEKANEICNKSQYNEATFVEKFQLNWHILFCKVCKLYSKQNSKITSICQQKVSEVKCVDQELSDKEKQELKERLKGLM